MKQQISILLQVDSVPEHGPKSPGDKKKCFERRVEDAMALVDSGYDSRAEWIFLRKLYATLVHKVKQGEASRWHMQLLKKIDPIMEKHGQHDPMGVPREADVLARVDRMLEEEGE